MAYLKELKIFLASPGDVAKERRYVDEVVDEVNRTIAAKKGFWLRVIRSERDAFPGYGKDGQAILNEQIGDMQEYELLVSMLWNRIGTSTPRAESGTLEEVERTVKSWLRKRKPQIWIYFRQSAAHFTTEEELEQRKGVLAFRSKFQKEKRGLFRDYKTPADFCKQFREQLNLWLSQQEEESTRSRANTSKQGKTVAVAKRKSVALPETQKGAKGASASKGAAKATQKPSVSEKSKKHSTGSKASVTDDRKKQTAPPTKTTVAKTKIATKPSTASRKASASKSTSTRNSGVVKGPRDWVMLDGKFFQAKLSSTQPDRSILLQIPPKTMEQTAELKALHPGEFNHRRQVTFADSHEAGIMQVTSVTNESTAGKISFSVTLNPSQRSQNNGFSMETSFNNHSADEIAELRARLILLGQALPKDLERFFPTQFYGPQNQPVILDKGIFPSMWTQLQTTQSQFLPKAWLWASYCLRMCQVIEDILELELGPIKNKVMPVRFRGKRKQVYSNQAASIISVVGNCILSA